MTPRARQWAFEVQQRQQLSPELVRLELVGPAAELPTTGCPDEWIGLVVPGQFQSRYYTIRHRTVDRILLDVVLHDSGLVSDWVQTQCVGAAVGVIEPKGAYAPPQDAEWVVALGDLTALPALAQIAETETRPTVLAAAAAHQIADYLPTTAQWLVSSGPTDGVLTDFVKNHRFPTSPGYVWFAAESAQMRTVRSYLLRELGLPNSRFHTMGYWRAVSGRQLRAIDPRPVAPVPSTENK